MGDNGNGIVRLVVRRAEADGFNVIDEFKPIYCRLTGCGVLSISSAEFLSSISSVAATGFRLSRNQLEAISRLGDTLAKDNPKLLDSLALFFSQKAEC